ncbi:MAG: HPr family phosphocarrier protein [Arenicella sp.]
MVQVEKEIINKLGLHARAAAKLLKCANQFSSTIELHCNDKEADAKSILSLMVLAAGKGTKVTIIANGEDEQIAVKEIGNLIDDYFGEGE